MLQHFRAILTIVAFVLIGLTLARPQPEEATKFIELEHTIKELTTSILKMNRGDDAQAMLAGMQGETADFNGLLN